MLDKLAGSLPAELKVTENSPKLILARTTATRTASSPTRLRPYEVKVYLSVMRVRFRWVRETP